MPAIRHDDLLLRLVKEVNDIKAALRRVVVNLPLYDIANENTPAQLTADQNNYPPGNYDILRLSSIKAVVITGMRGGIKGRSIRVFNDGNYPICFENQNSSSDAINRFDINYNKILFPKETVIFYYDSTNTRWVIVNEKIIPYEIKGYTQGDSIADNFPSICWSPELGLFCAVVYSGANRVLTSPDGTTWTLRTASESNLWFSVCWSPELGIFCAVASDGTNRVMTSPNGILWTSHAAAEGNSWRSVTWSPELGIFCAVASDGTNQVMTSPDGENWTSRMASASNFWRSITWSPELGIFCAIASSGTNLVMTSPDGENWTSHTAAVEGVGAGWKSICWSPSLNLFCAVSQYPYSENPSTQGIMTSPNGTVWTARNGPPGNNIADPYYWNSVSWSEELGLFMAVGWGTDYKIATSSDGVVWKASYSNIIDGSFALNCVVWSKEIFKFCFLSSNAYVAI